MNLPPSDEAKKDAAALLRFFKGPWMTRWKEIGDVCLDDPVSVLNEQMRVAAAYTGDKSFTNIEWPIEDDDDELDDEEY